MTTTTPRLIDRRERRRNRRSGFTLVEILIGAALGAFVLAAVLSAFFFITRSGKNLYNYMDMQMQARKALETFAEDVRQASSISWTSSTDFTLTVNSTSIEYYYSSTDATFYRKVSSGTPSSLITGIVSGTFAINAYNIAGTQLTLVSSTDLTNAGKSTKQIQLSLQAGRTLATHVSATNLVLSARYILRNKTVTA